MRNGRKRVITEFASKVKLSFKLENNSSFKNPYCRFSEVIFEYKWQKEHIFSAQRFTNRTLDSERSFNFLGSVPNDGFVRGILFRDIILARPFQLLCDLIFVRERVSFLEQSVSSVSSTSLWERASSEMRSSFMSDCVSSLSSNDLTERGKSINFLVYISLGSPHCHGIVQSRIR